MNKTDKVLALTELMFRFMNENRSGVFYLRCSFSNADQKGREKLQIMEECRKMFPLMHRYLANTLWYSGISISITLLV